MNSHPTTRDQANGPDGVPWRALGLYVLLAFAGFWIAVLPLLVVGFRRASVGNDMSVLAEVCVYAAMLTPALAALVVLRFRHRVRRPLTSVGLIPRQPLRSIVGPALLAVAVPFGLQLVTLAIAAVAGTYHLDLTDFSGFRAQFAPELVGQSGPPWPALLAWAGGTAVTYVLTLPFFFGEELGWQGYLFPRLRPLGIWPAMSLTAVVFALWHLPSLIMGGQYPGHSLAVSVGAMLLSTVLLVPIFTWLRLHSRSVWPAVFAHAVVSGPGIQLVWLFSDARHPIDPLQVGLNGWPGWIAMALFVAFLAGTGRLTSAATAVPGRERSGSAC